MFSICKNFIKVNDDLYLVIKPYNEERVNDIEAVKKLLGADSVFKKDNLLYFCTKIEELEIIN
jgi:hypothetical protein